MKEKDFEIVTPVSSYESLMAAIQGGANPIYFGVEGLNIRSRSSSNFATEGLRKIVTICGEHGIKSYLTVNMAIYGEDLPLIREIIDTAKDTGVSAIITAGVAAMSYADSIGQGVHLSAQLDISSVEALKFYVHFADVVVLARELNLKQVHETYQETVEQQIKGPKGELIRIGMFAHGALCMAVSDKCYLSLHEMNASANRRVYIQICRRAYTVHDKDSQIELGVENQYIMSSKDLKTVHFMNKMVGAGVRVLKLEGCTHRPGCMRLVTECRKEAVKACYEGTLNREKIAAWDERLRRVFSRGFWDSYYLGQRLGEWSSKCGSGAARKKMYMARGIKYFNGIGVAKFEMGSGSLRVGDEILVTGPTTGTVMQTVDKVRVDLEPVEGTVKRERSPIEMSEKIRPSDRLYRMEKVRIEKELR